MDSRQGQHQHRSCHWMTGQGLLWQRGPEEKVGRRGESTYLIESRSEMRRDEMVFALLDTFYPFRLTRIAENTDHKPTRTILVARLPANLNHRCPLHALWARTYQCTNVESRLVALTLSRELEAARSIQRRRRDGLLQAINPTCNSNPNRLVIPSFYPEQESPSKIHIFSLLSIPAIGFSTAATPWTVFSKALLPMRIFISFLTCMTAW